MKKAHRGGGEKKKNTEREDTGYTTIGREERQERAPTLTTFRSQAFFWRRRTSGVLANWTKAQESSGLSSALD
jgi:hypothetical protein